MATRRIEGGGCSSQLSTWIFDGFVPTWKYDKEGKIIPPAALPRLNRYEKKSSAAAVILSPCQIMGIWSARGHFGCGLRRWIHTLCERFHNLHHLLLCQLVAVRRGGDLVSACRPHCHRRCSTKRYILLWALHIVAEDSNLFKRYAKISDYYIYCC